jgi:hypothetical protein
LRFASLPRRLGRVLAALLAAGAFQGAARAFEVSVGAAQQRYQSTERFPSGAVNNEEQGTLRGARLRASAGSSAWTLAVEGQRTSGTLTYDGRSQIGLPLQTLTDLRQSEASALLLRRFWDGLVETGGGVGARKVDRHIRSTPPSALYPSGTQGLTEQLSSTELRAAARLHSPVSFAGRFGFEADWLYNVNGRLNADFLGAFDATQVKLDNWSGWMARVSWARQFGELRVRAFHEWHRHEPPASAARALTVGGSDAGASFQYPGSEVRSRTLGLEVGISF